MNLVLDIGNTLNKIAVFSDNDEILYFSSRKEISILFLEEIFLKYCVKNAIISSVAIPNSEIIDWLNKNVNLVEMSPKCRLPIKINYESPETLGTDRIANAVGANKLFPNQNVLSIMAGTCLVADFVNSKNEYLGGSISPGLTMRFDALNHFTARLPKVNLSNVDFLIGSSTEKSILSGVVNGMIFEINGIMDMYSTVYPDIEIIISGGDSEMLKNYLKKSIFAAQNPILLGLNEILRLNVENE